MNQSKNKSSINPPSYVRANKEWSRWLGKQGIITAVTTICVASDAHSVFTPYQYAVVSFEGDPATPKKSFVVADGHEISIGDRVQCALRRLSKPNDSGIIEYGIKVVRL